MTTTTDALSINGLVDLASELVGGRTLGTSDDYFAEVSNLLKPGRGVFIADKFTERGKWMDGWESRRKREQGYDWAVIALGLAGEVRAFDIDTNHFLGNHAPFASVEGTYAPGASIEDLQEATWTKLLSQHPLRPGSQNLFVADQPVRCTHVRLNIFPDGGVARFRVMGRVDPQWRPPHPQCGAQPGEVDLVALENGGMPLACSDSFFSPMSNLILAAAPANMGQGWESRRRRAPGHDWVIIRAGAPGVIRMIDVDTKFFKGNFPHHVNLEAIHAPGADVVDLAKSQDWKPVLGDVELQADKSHRFREEVVDVGPITHVRMNIFPDGGVARLRVWGERTK